MTTDGDLDAQALGIRVGLGRWRWLVVEVSGDSMRPALVPGQRVLARVTRDVRPGQVVLMRRPDVPSQLLIKRVVRWSEASATGASDAGWWVEGDNRARSTDSRDFGPVSPELVIARMRG